MICHPVNDEECLTKVSYRALEASQTTEILSLAHQFASTAEVARWIRSLPQRNDIGEPSDGPKVECDVSQRVRIPADDPNCVERAAMYLAMAECLDPRAVRQLATMSTPLGRHTFAVENDVPVHLDPTVTRNALEAGMMAMVPLATTPHLSAQESLAWTLGLAQEPIERNQGRDFFRTATRTGFTLLEGRHVSQRNAEILGTAFAMAEQEARMFGEMGLDLVHVTLRGLEAMLERATYRLVSNLDHCVAKIQQSFVHTQKVDHKLDQTRSDMTGHDPKSRTSCQLRMRNTSWNLATLERLAKTGTKLALPITKMAIKTKLASWGIPPQFVDELGKQLFEGSSQPTKSAPSEPTSSSETMHSSNDAARVRKQLVVDVSWGTLSAVAVAT